MSLIYGGLLSFAYFEATIDSEMRHAADTFTKLFPLCLHFTPVHLGKKVWKKKKKSIE
jgi:hypothetical protein